MTNTDAAREPTIVRSEAIGTLIDMAEQVSGNGAGDLLDMLGRIRLVELAADQARRAVVAEARNDGYKWQEIADTLGVSRQAVQERFGAKEHRELATGKTSGASENVPSEGE